MKLPTQYKILNIIYFNVLIDIIYIIIIKHFYIKVGI